MITQLTLPASEPVSLANMKEYLRVDHADEDGLITLLIAAARRTAEHLTGQVIAQRTFRVDWRSFSNGVLPLCPVVSVSAVQYFDSVSGELRALNGSTFFPYPLAPQIFAPAGGWPATLARPDAVQVVCTAGMNPVPEDIQDWVMLRVSTAYENREVVTDIKSGVLPRSFVDGLLDPYRVARV